MKQFANINLSEFKEPSPSINSFTHTLSCQLSEAQCWALQRFLEDNQECNAEDCEIVNLDSNWLAYYVRKRKDAELDLPPDHKPWEYVVKSTILWVGYQTDFLHWMDVNVPKSRLLQSFRSPNVLKAVDSENVYYRVCDEITLRGMQPQMIIIHNDSYLTDDQHLEIKGMQTFAHTIFLEDYD